MAENSNEIADTVRTPAVYTNASLRTVTLCEETGYKARPGGICPVHLGDACLYEYRHPYDNAVDRWKKAKQWGEYDAVPCEQSDGTEPIPDMDPDNLPSGKSFGFKVPRNDGGDI